MVWAEGLEPSTNRVEVGCSIRLSYAHMFCNAFIQSTRLPQQVALHETYFLPKGVYHAGAGKGTRTPTPFGHRNLNPARLPIPTIPAYLD